jgi:hypothetical protein
MPVIQFPAHISLKEEQVHVAKCFCNAHKLKTESLTTNSALQACWSFNFDDAIQFLPETASCS